MAVTVLGKKTVGRTVTSDINGQHTSQQVWLVKSDTLNTSLQDVLGASGLPVFGDYSSEFTNQRFAGKVATQVEDYLYEVTVSFRKNVPSVVAQNSQTGGVGGLYSGSTSTGASGSGGGGGSGGTEAPTNPILAPWIWRISTQPYQEYLTKDYDGDQILNSAERPFPARLFDEHGMIQISVTGNVAISEINWSEIASIKSLYGAVNSETHLGCSPYFLKFVDFSAESRPDATYPHWAITQTYLYNNKSSTTGWRYVEVLDEGLEELIGGEHIPITDGGIAITQPMALDGAGQRLAPGSPPYYKLFATARLYDLNQLLLN